MEGAPHADALVPEVGQCTGPSPNLPPGRPPQPWYTHRPTAEGRAAWRTPTVTGTLGTWPATSVTSPWAPGADNSTDGPATDSSTKPDPPPTPAKAIHSQLPPARMRQLPAWEQAQLRARAAGLQVTQYGGGAPAAVPLLRRPAAEAAVIGSAATWTSSHQRVSEVAGVEIELLCD